MASKSSQVYGTPEDYINVFSTEDYLNMGWEKIGGPFVEVWHNAVNASKFPKLSVYDTYMYMLRVLSKQV